MLAIGRSQGGGERGAERLQPYSPARREVKHKELEGGPSFKFPGSKPGARWGLEVCMQPAAVEGALRGDGRLRPRFLAYASSWYQQLVEYSVMESYERVGMAEQVNCTFEISLAINRHGGGRWELGSPDTGRKSVEGAVSHS